MSQPLDQDWNLDSIVRDEDSVLEINIVKVKPGKEDDFERLLKDVDTFVINSRSVVAFNRFTIDRELNAPDGSRNPLKFDAEGKELFTLEFKNKEARAEAMQDQRVQDVIQQLKQTYDCIACEIVGAPFDSDAFPPF